MFELNKNNPLEVYEIIKSLEPGVVEGFINEHPEMKKISSGAVTTLRIVTVKTKSEYPGVEKDKLHFLYAGLRIAKGDFVVSGDMLVVLDLDTGVVITDAADSKNNVYITHPVTGEPFKGFKVPYYVEAKEMLENASEDVYRHLMFR